MYKVKIYRDGTTYMELTDKWDDHCVSFTSNTLENACYKQTLYLEQHQQVWDTIYYLEKQFEKTDNTEELKNVINTLKRWVVNESYKV